MDKKELNAYIGKKIKEFRNKKNLTQEELGNKIGLGNTTISAYERGAISSDSDSLYTLARELDVKVDSFFPPFELDSLERVRGMRNENMAPKDMLFFKELVEKTNSMDAEERAKFLESLKFTIEYYNKLKD